MNKKTIKSKIRKLFKEIGRYQKMLGDLGRARKRQEDLKFLKRMPYKVGDIVCKSDYDEKRGAWIHQGPPYFVVLELLPNGPHWNAPCVTIARLDKDGKRTRAIQKPYWAWIAKEGTIGDWYDNFKKRRDS